jgi:flagellar biosynthesis GTPase FlhF
METTTTDVRTFRGKTLEEVLPQVREALGPDAVVLRRREGLVGGVAGFFQRPYVEVDARKPLPDEVDPVPRNDRATSDGMSSTVVRALLEQASPFADALARAERGVGTRAEEFLASEAADAGLYGPQPNRPAAEDEPQMPSFEPAAVAQEPVFEEPEPEQIVALRPPAKTAPAPAQGPQVPPSAAGIEKSLVAHGLSPSLAADVVGEAVAHGLPFATPRNLKKLVRTALSRRIMALSRPGDKSPRIAFVGAGGAGKTTAIAHLAQAYAAAGADVVVVALKTSDGGAQLSSSLEPLGIAVIAAVDAADAKRRLGRRNAAIVFIDTPPVGLGDRQTAATLAGELRALDADEVHFALPATLSAGAADEQYAALAPLAITDLALTHADGTTRPGAPIELAITAHRPVSYFCTRDGVDPADPIDLAQRLLP